MNMLSWLGQMIRPPKRAVTDELGIGAVMNRWSDYPSFGLTPGRLRSILWQGDQGYMRLLMELYEEMEEKDAHLGAILQTRKLAVLGLPLEISPASDDAKDQEIAQFVDEQLKNISDLQGDLMDLLDAIGKGYSASEIHWEYQNKQAVVAGIEWIPAKCISFVNSPTPLIITEANGAWIAPPPWKIIFHRNRGRSGDVCRGGVLRSCTLPYLLKSYNWKFWAVYNEVHGMPLRLGKYNSTASDEDRKALKDALKSIGSDAYAVTSENTSIEFVEAAKAGTGKVLPYEVLIQVCNREMSKAVLGQTLTTESAPGSGTLAGNAHENVRQDLVEADAKDLAAVFRDQLVRPLVGFNYGWDAPLPLVTLVGQEAIDFKMESEALGNFVRIGLDISKSHCYQRYGIPKPEKGEDVLQPSANTPPASAVDEIPPGPSAAKGGEEPAAMKDGASIFAEEVLESHIGAETVKSLSHSEIEKLKSLYLYAPELYRREVHLLLKAKINPDIHEELDNLTQAASAEAQDYLGRMMAPVAELIESGESLEDIRDKLLQVYDRIDTRSLEALMGRVRIMANLRGRVNQ